MNTKVVSWGRLTHAPHQVEALHDRTRLRLGASASVPGLAYGNGRSYGDVCLNPGGLLWRTRGLDRFIAFDAATGQLECEAGVLLDDIIALALPQGWFPGVTPGTRYVTVGGAIANDVHGKNHHGAGTFGEHVLSLRLLRCDGEIITCGPHERADWFRATVAGLGLTGLIVSARLQLRRVPGPWLESETNIFEGLDQFFALSSASDPAWEYSVAWIDCVHPGRHGCRGAFFRANHHASEAPAPREYRRAVGFVPPFSLVNGAPLRLFNSAYFQRQKSMRGRRVVHWRPFFYPLDSILHWNRIYGPKGFYQYQCVLPRAVEADATAEMLAAIRASGTGSFLAVLKTFGDRSPVGLLSFPMPGTTLALDFPNHGSRNERLFERLDAIVQATGGRIYPAKDARMSRSLFERGQPRLQEFSSFRDPGISSAMSRRLMGA